MQRWTPEVGEERRVQGRISEEDEGIGDGAQDMRGGRGHRCRRHRGLPLGLDEVVSRARRELR